MERTSLCKKQSHFALLTGITPRRRYYADSSSVLLFAFFRWNLQLWEWKGNEGGGMICTRGRNPQNQSAACVVCSFAEGGKSTHMVPPKIVLFFSFLALCNLRIGVPPLHNMTDNFGNSISQTISHLGSLPSRTNAVRETKEKRAFVHFQTDWDSHGSCFSAV